MSDQKSGMASDVNQLTILIKENEKLKKLAYYHAGMGNTDTYKNLAETYRLALKNQNDKVVSLEETLALYANPESYFAIMILPDRPAGWFADDISENHGNSFFDRPMHGAAARAAIDWKDWIFVEDEEV